MRNPPLLLRIVVLAISSFLALGFLGYRVGAFDWLLGKPAQSTDEFDGIKTKIMGGSKSDGGL